MMADGRFQAGQIAWNKKTPIEKTCPTCHKAFLVKPSLDRIIYCSRRCARVGKPSNMKGRQASAETRQKQRTAKLGIRGPDHWNWRGGSGSARKQIMRRDEYVQWRKAVFVRDDFTCASCGARGCELHADHIRSWAGHPERRFEVSNGRTLCVPCHCQTPSFPKQLIPKELRNWRTM